MWCVGSAETFAENPAVIGYDLLNEPFGDEVTEIGPLYEDIAKRIRKHDTKGIFFIEPQVNHKLVASIVGFSQCLPKRGRKLQHR